MGVSQTGGSRFATVEEVTTPHFASINSVLDEITVRYGLPDHTELNAARYPWSEGMLSTPAFYAARLWEYPFAISAADLHAGMKVADVGCGMTAFTIYLKEVSKCDVAGVDPDLFDADVKYLGHGVSHDFISRTGLKIVKGDFDRIPLETGSQDRAFCISVMEHVPPETQRRGMREMARILKPGGLAILTVDMSMFFELSRPLDLVWDSGLALVQPVDLGWPTRRFGMFSDEGLEGLPADVLGMVLVKEDRRVDTAYRGGEQAVSSIPAYLVPTLVPRSSQELTLRRRIRARLGRMLDR